MSLEAIKLLVAELDETELESLREFVNQSSNHKEIDEDSLQKREFIFGLHASESYYMSEDFNDELPASFWGWSQE